MLKADLRRFTSIIKKEKLSIILGLTFGLIISVPSLGKSDMTGRVFSIVHAQENVNIDIKDTVNTVVLDLPKSYSEVFTTAILEDKSVQRNVIDDTTLYEADEQRIEEERKAEEARKKKEAEEARIAKEKAEAKRKKKEAEAREQAEIQLCNDTEPNVPDWLKACDSSAKTFMGYTAVTSKNSAQYKLLNGDRAYTDKKTGLRMVDGRICIAVGSGYCSTIGTKINLVMEDGSIVKCIMGDAKADKHTDSTHRYHYLDGSVAEFIVDYKYFDRHNDVIRDIDGLAGDIIKVVVIKD